MGTGAVLEALRAHPDVLAEEVSRRDRREYALSGTAAFGEVMGVNCYNPDEGTIPWMIPGIHGRMVELLDRVVKNIDNPVKIICIPRGHFKTSICACALVRRMLSRPSSRNAVFSAKEGLAQKTMRQVRQVLTSDECQYLFSDLLFKPTDREKYTRTEIHLDYPRVGGEPSVKAFGMETSSTGFHFDGILWVDDLIDWIIAQSVDEMKKAENALADLIAAIADPGCEIWMTFTRYNLNDPYEKILSPDGYLRNRTVKPVMWESCYQTTENGREPIFPLRFCERMEECGEGVEWNGKVIEIPRKSLESIREEFGEVYFSEQYLNRPIPEGNTSFSREWFNDVIDVGGHDFFDWMEQQPNYGSVAPFPERDGRGPWEIAILGDPAYGTRAHNDCAVLWVVAVDRFNHWFLLDFHRAKYGVHKIDDYCRRALDYYKRYGDMCSHNIGKWLAVESHGSGIMIDAALRRLALEMGISPRKAQLKANSYTKKELRIMSLEPIAGGHRLHFCKNVDEGRKQLALESQTFMSSGSDDVIDTLANGTQVFRVRSQKVRKNAGMADFSHLPRRVRRFLA